MLELFAEIFGKWNNRRRAWIAQRTTRNELDRLSNHDLQDIGLSRGDITWISKTAYSEEMNRLTNASLAYPLHPRVESNPNLKGWTF